MHAWDMGTHCTMLFSLVFLLLWKQESFQLQANVCDTVCMCVYVVCSELIGPRDRDDTTGSVGDMDDENLKDLSSEEREALLRVMLRAKVSLLRRLGRTMRSSAQVSVH